MTSTNMTAMAPSELNAIAAQTRTASPVVVEKTLNGARLMGADRATVFHSHALHNVARLVQEVARLRRENAALARALQSKGSGAHHV